MRPVVERFHISGSAEPRPVVGRTIYADGAGAHRTRHPSDIELSHWVPNTTDPRYQADSSTEICCRYAADPERQDADLVVNDHVDVDGVLALFTLLHPDVALANRATVVAAAELGDFHAWADRPGFELSQELWRGLTADDTVALDPVRRYELGFEIATGVLTGRRSISPATAAGWAQIRAGVELIDRGIVSVEVVHERLVSFVYPPSIPVAAALGVPVLNQSVDDSIALWPQVRNRDHGQRVQLLSVPAPGGGWLHDLCAPAYSWADTPHRWRLPGLVSTGDSNRWSFDDPLLDGAVDVLRGTETAFGRWAVADHLTPFAALDGRGFPVVLSFVDDAGRPASSALGPDQVVRALAPVWVDPR